MLFTSSKVVRLPQQLNVYSLLATVNLLIAGFVIFVYVEIQSLSDFWENKTSQTIQTAEKLVELEHDLGYRGFIHNFKNYILRGSDNYFFQAKYQYELTIDVINDLKPLLESKKDLHALSSIETTFNSYYQQLLVAREKHQSVTVSELDKLVKVDDSEAEQALNLLRLNILPKLHTIKQDVDGKVSDLKFQTMLFASILIPIFLFSNLLTIIYVRKLSVTKAEIATIVDSSPNAVLFIDNQGKVLRSNPVAQLMFGLDEEQFFHQRFDNLFDPSFAKQLPQIREQAETNPHQANQLLKKNMELIAYKKDNSEFHITLSVSITLIAGEVRWICIITDISQHKIDRLAANQDHLTAVHNRRSLEALLLEACSRCYRESQPLSLMLIDLDNFKIVNDHYGHDKGDKALKSVADHINEYSRESDSLARWGGDEFVLLSPNLNKTHAIELAERIRSTFYKSVIAEEFGLSLSIGIVTVDGTKKIDDKLLIDMADQALYKAKKLGRNKVVHVDDLV